MNPNDPKELIEVETRFDHALQEDIPELEINTFRESFETAWQQRSWYRRIISKPILSSLFFITAVVGIGSSSFLYFQMDALQEKSAYALPNLMPGQRFSSNQELLSHFPPLQQGSIIAVDHENTVSTFIAHGYLLDGDVQIVWEY